MLRHRALRFMLLGGASLGACGPKAEIPAHYTAADWERDQAAADPTHLLEGGTLVFEEHFQGTGIPKLWQVELLEEEKHDPDWQVRDGWLYGKRVRNQGLYAKVLPTEGDLRIEFTAKSAQPTSGTFPGDLKIEAFNTSPNHEAGYSFINGGWGNSLDTIAKLGEHSADDKRKPALPLEPDQSYRYAIVATAKGFHFFRDGQLLYHFPDNNPVRGPWLGLNNWLSDAYFTDIAVYTLTPP